MKISKKNRSLIVKELKYVADSMDEHVTGQEKLYYFSGTYAVVQRILNTEFSQDLAFLHFVLRQTFDSFNGRLQAIIKAGETVIQLTEEHFEKLSTLTKELADKIGKSEDLNDTLKKITVLTYTTTGNGFYLMQKGVINLNSI